MNTKEKYGEKMTSSIITATKGLKETLMTMQEFAKVYSDELNGRINDASVSESEKIALRKELAELDRPEVKNSEKVVKQLDDAMDKLKYAIESAFKVKK